MSITSCRDDGGPTELILMGKDVEQNALVDEWNTFQRGLRLSGI